MRQPPRQALVPAPGMGFAAARFLRRSGRVSAGALSGISASGSGGECSDLLGGDAAAADGGALVTFGFVAAHELGDQGSVDGQVFEQTAAANAHRVLHAGITLLWDIARGRVEGPRSTARAA